MKWMDYRKQLGLSINCKTKMSLFRQEMLNVFNLYKDWPYSSKEYIFFVISWGFLSIMMNVLKPWKMPRAG